MAIRFYMNGTVGAQDGTEISTGDLSNPLVADGFYPAAGITVSKNIIIMVRADTGETWKDVILGVVSTDTDERAKFNLVVTTNGHRIGSRGCIYYYPIIETVASTNISLTLKVSASGNESNSPDTTQKLMVIGGVKIA